MMFDSLVFNIGVVANGQWQWGLILQGVMWRPINIGGELQGGIGTFNIDAITAQPHDNDMFYLDATQNRGSPFNVSFNNHGWLWPRIQLIVWISGFALLGVLTMRMWYEEIIIKKPDPQKVSIEESIQIKTDPRWWKKW